MSGLNEVVYFIVTNIEHDILPHETTPDIYGGSITGELGCWIDPTVTRMVQTGVEHTRVPSVTPHIENGAP